MHFLVYGAGAIGGVVGARVAEAGCDVTLVARGEHYQAIKRDGLTIEDLDGTRKLRLPVVDSSSLDLDAVLATDFAGPETVVVLAVKSQHTAAALDSLRRVVPPEAPIVCAQNGIDNERQAARRFTAVYGAYVSCMASHVQPGEVRAHSGPVLGTIDIGRFPGGTDDVAEKVAAHLRAAGFDSEASADIMSWKRDKLILNLATTVEAICGPGEVRERLAAAVRAEGRAAFAAAALSLPSADAKARRAMAKPTIVIPREGGSTWQSLRRHTGNVESDYINGEIGLLGRLFGMPTPANDLVQRVAAGLAFGGAEPGSLPEQELLRLLEAASA